MDTISEGLTEQRRVKITNEPRRSTEVGNHEAVKIGNLGRTRRRSRWSSSSSTRRSTAVREGVDELILREGEEGALLSFFQQ